MKKQIKIPYLVICSFVVNTHNKLPWPESSNAQPQNELATSFHHSKLGI